MSASRTAIAITFVGSALAGCTGSTAGELRAARTTPTGATAPTTLPLTTSATAPTTTVESTTTVPPTTTTTVLPPRPSAPKKGRPQPPGAIPVWGDPLVPGEGTWQPLGAAVGGAAAMYSTVLRTSATGPYVASIVWIDNVALTGQLFPGTVEPGGQWNTPSAIPPEQQPAVVAAFNGGFVMSESKGGFFLEGREQVPLVDGAASFVVLEDGTMTVGRWGRDISMDQKPIAVRQNLPLLVDGGAVAASANDYDVWVWGKTLGKTPTPWRSGIGMREDGTLVYIGGPGLTARGIGDLFVAAGAVRAMELDINPEWVTFNVYTFDPRSGRVNSTKVMPDQLHAATRYLTPDKRDFIALEARFGA